MSDITDPIDVYRTYQNQMEAAKKEMQKVARQAVEAGSKLIFDKYPELVSFSWTQYTPYFMDGDVCEFGVNRDEPDLVVLVDGEEEEMEGYDVSDAAVPIQEAIRDFLDIFDEDTLKTVFGDHSSVTVHRTKGVRRSNYDHD